VHWARILFGAELPATGAAREAIKTAGVEFFEHALSALTQHGTDFKAVSESLKKSSGRSGKALFQPLRAALTGELDGPEMVRILPLLGVERARQRLEQRPV
jgi:glutamyl-tRNA synthetase